MTSYRALRIHPGTVEASVKDAVRPTGTHATRSKPPAGIPMPACSATRGVSGAHDVTTDLRETGSPHAKRKAIKAPENGRETFITLEQKTPS